MGWKHSIKKYIAGFFQIKDIDSNTFMPEIRSSGLNSLNVSATSFKKMVAIYRSFKFFLLQPCMVLGKTISMGVTFYFKQGDAYIVDYCDYH